jgi:hypothetical protein
MLMAVVALLLVTAFTVDALRLCRGFVAGLRDAVSAGQPQADDQWINSDSVDHEPRQAIEFIRLIASMTHLVGKLAWYPLSLIFLMVLARSKTFDMVDFSWPLLVVWIGLSGAVVVQMWLLRRAADETRDKILSRLRQLRMALIGQQTSPHLDARIDAAIQEIQGEDEGAFRPFSRDPLFHSLALLFGGSGSVLLLEQLIPYL